MSADRGFEKDGGADETVSKKQDGSGSGATDIFGTFSEQTHTAPAQESAWETVRETPPASAPPPVAEEPVPRAAQPVAAPIPIKSGGFTQLLRALNYEQIKPQPEQIKPETSASGVAGAGAVDATVPKIATGGQVVEPAVAPVVESVTMAALRALDARRSAQPEPFNAPAAANTEGNSPAQVTSFQQAVAPPPASRSPDPGSFTQMFESLDVPQQTNPKERVAVGQTVAASATHEEHLPADARRTAEIPLPVPPASPGSFTQMFQSLGHASDDVAAPAGAVQPAAVAPASFTAIFGAVASEPVPANKPAEATGSTTQVFRTFDGGQTGSSTKPGGAAVPVAPAPASPAVADNAPEVGSFTQVFRALDAGPAGPAIPVDAHAPVQVEASAVGSFTQMFRAAGPEPVARAQPAPQLGEAAGGSFTEIFRSLEAEQPATHTSSASPAGDAPGTFTQMFRTLDPATPEAPTVRQNADASFTPMFGAAEPSRPPMKPEEAGLQGSGGASQMFSTYRPPVEAMRQPEFTQAGYAPPTPTAAARPASGGLTQLLRTLDSPTQPVPAARAPGPPSQQPGSFTSVYGKLDGSPSVAPSAGLAAASPPMPPYAPPVAAGKDATQAFRPAVPAPAVSAGPSEFTRILNASQFREDALRMGGAVGGQSPAAATPATGAGSPSAVSVPAMPATPQWTPPVAPVASFAPPAAPQMPAVPQGKLPEAPKAAAGGSMQQYLPLLLILIIILLLAILVAVIFLMKK